jgi:hypothetical protein
VPLGVAARLYAVAFTSPINPFSPQTPVWLQLQPQGTYDPYLSHPRASVPSGKRVLLYLRSPWLKFPDFRWEREEVLLKLWPAVILPKPFGQVSTPTNAKLPIPVFRVQDLLHACSASSLQPHLHTAPLLP